MDFVNEFPQGSTIGFKETMTMLEDDSQRKNAKADGFFHLPDAKRSCYQTVRNYMTLAAAVVPTTLTETAVQKTEVRETAEKSIRSAIAFLILQWQ